MTIVSVWFRCHHCGARPTIGAAYRCKTCPAGPLNDLCEACHAAWEKGGIAHPGEDQPTFTGLAEPHTFKRFEGRDASELASWFSIPEAQAPAPVVAPASVVRPEFYAGEESHLGSYAFAVETDRGPLVLTALHIMEEIAKSQAIDCSEDNESYTGRELPSVITDVRLYDVFAAKWILAELGSCGPMWILEDARSGAEEPFANRDIAAFSLPPQHALSPMKLAEQAPEVGQPVWLAAKVAGNERTLRATVVERTARTFIFRFDRANDELFTSGAPLLNSAGEVVGLSVGGGMLEGRTFGHANQASSLRQHLENGALG